VAIIGIITRSSVSSLESSCSRTSRDFLRKGHSPSATHLFPPFFSYPASFRYPRQAWSIHSTCLKYRAARATSAKKTLKIGCSKMQYRSDLERWRPDTFHKIIFTLLFLERSSKEWSHTDVFFHWQIYFAPQLPALFRHLNSKKVHNNWFFLFRLRTYWSQRAYFSIPSYCTNPMLFFRAICIFFFLPFRCDSDRIR